MKKFFLLFSTVMVVYVAFSMDNNASEEIIKKYPGRFDVFCGIWGNLVRQEMYAEATSFSLEMCKQADKVKYLSLCSVGISNILQNKLDEGESYLKKVPQKSVDSDINRTVEFAYAYLFKKRGKKKKALKYFDKVVKSPCQKNNQYYSASLNILKFKLENNNSDGVKDLLDECIKSNSIVFRYKALLYNARFLSTESPKKALKELRKMDISLIDSKFKTKVSELKSDIKNRIKENKR